ncbi:MAG: ATP-binding cassette domain-containing protein [Chloroflexi bacterium]|nr:ATP-binding cassette domain-containing protein [Chloroflexota bacterium]
MKERGCAIAVIEAEGLVKEYERGVRALNGIDLSVEEGEIFGFLGQNGSGKSTTIRILTTLLAPTAGGGRIAGLDIRRDAGRVRERIGVALQEAGLDDLQTGAELLLLQGRLYGMGGAQVRRRVAELLELVDLAGDAERPIRTYSGGMKRRLDLASALIHAPSIVFLDEPTTGLDPIARDTIWRYIERLNQEDRVTFFLTTQYLEEADRLAHRIAILDAGEIVAEGSPAELKAEIGTDVVTVQVAAPEDARRAAEVARGLAGVADVRVTENSAAVYVADGGAAVARIVRLLDDAAAPFTSITLAQPTLDDVFLRATGHYLQVDDAGEERAD